MGPNTNPVAQKHSYGLRDIHAFYIKDCKSNGRKDYIDTYTEFRDIVMSLFVEMMRVIMDEFRQITLPQKMGTFYVKKSKPRDPSLWLDKMSTKKKLAYLSGLRDGSSKRFFWSKALCNLPSKGVYVFNLVPKWRHKIKGYKSWNK